MPADVKRYTLAQYQKLRDHAICVCRHRRKHHDATQKCAYDGCTCLRYGTRTNWQRGSKPKDDAAHFESMDDQVAQEHYMCMYFDDAAEVPEACQRLGEQVGTIEVPLWVVDVTWRTGISTTQSYANMKVAPAAHPLERGCFTTMPLVLCTTHKRILLT